MILPSGQSRASGGTAPGGLIDEEAVISPEGLPTTGDRFREDDAGPEPLALVDLPAMAGVTQRTHRILTPLAFVGRGAHNDIVLLHETVSDSHAKFQRHDGAWLVADLASRNGTWVAGRRVEDVSALSSNGPVEVRFGQVEVIFQGNAGIDAEDVLPEAVHDGGELLDAVQPLGASRVVDGWVAGPSRRLPAWIWIATTLLAFAVGVVLLLTSR